MEAIIHHLREKIRKHNIRSGEIIIEYDTSSETRNPQVSISNFFEKYGIKIENSDYMFSQTTKDEAIQSTLYGLNTKLNYTVIDKEFTESDKNEIVYIFMQLFTQPIYYTLDCRLRQKDLDRNDFREMGGMIVLDKKSIGILWINDLYDMLEK